MLKKIRTTPLQREILSALANTGGCSLPALLSSLRSKFPHLASAALQDNVEQSLGILWRAGCIYLMRIIDGEKRTVLVPEMKELDLGKLLRWDGASDRWIAGENNVADVIIQITNNGVQWLEVIAAESSNPLYVRKPSH
jgi:hypothetical protein